MTAAFKDGSFIDSNIWLYALSQKTHDPAANKKREIALELTQTSGIVISFQVINEVCINAIRKLSFTTEEVVELIEDFYSGCIVIESSKSLSLKATEIRTRYQISFWDSSIVAAALQAQVSTLYSEDMQNRLTINNSVQLVNPFLPSSPS